MNLLVLAHQNLLDERDVLPAQHVPDLRKAHAQLLHVGDHVQARVLVHVVVAVAGFGIDIPRAQQAHAVVQAQRGNADVVELRHRADGNELPVHAHALLSKSVSGLEFITLRRDVKAPEGDFSRIDAD